jgi:hypothetical protein
MLIMDKQYEGLDKELQAARARLGSPKQALEWFSVFAEKDLTKLAPTELLLDKYNLLSTAISSKFTALLWSTFMRPKQFNDPANFAKPLTMQVLIRIQHGINGALADLFGRGICHLSRRFAVRA